MQHPFCRHPFTACSPFHRHSVRARARAVRCRTQASTSMPKSTSTARRSTPPCQRVLWLPQSSLWRLASRSTRERALPRSLMTVGVLQPPFSSLSWRQAPAMEFCLMTISACTRCSESPSTTIPDGTTKLARRAGSRCSSRARAQLIWGLAPPIVASRWRATVESSSTCSRVCSALSAVCTTVWLPIATQQTMADGACSKMPLPLASSCATKRAFRSPSGCRRAICRRSLHPAQKC